LVLGIRADNTREIERTFEQLCHALSLTISPTDPYRYRRSSLELKLGIGDLTALLSEYIHSVCCISSYKIILKPIIQRAYTQFIMMLCIFPRLLNFYFCFNYREKLIRKATVEFGYKFYAVFKHRLSPDQCLLSTTCTKFHFSQGR
jgi:hypothetical protein